jgi:diguanylate cyclase (GGDEF)-like protein
MTPENHRRLRRLQRRDWWMWLTGSAVMLALTAAIVSFSFPALFRDQNAFFTFNLEQAVRGLVGVVLLFNVYAIYQQVAMKRLHRQLVMQVETSARLETRAEMLQKLAMLDPLTGLHNRRAAEDRLASEVSRSNRYGHPFTLILLDLNDFKQINDRYGHAAGDQVLRAFAEQLIGASRATDFAVRLGGDEFLMILPECSLANASAFVDRLAPVRVELDGASITVPYSAGWAGFQKGDTSESILKRADQMLYGQKRSTRATSAQLAATQ